MFVLKLPKGLNKPIRFCHDSVCRYVGSTFRRYLGSDVSGVCRLVDVAVKLQFTPGGYVREWDTCLIAIVLQDTVDFIPVIEQACKASR